MKEQLARAQTSLKQSCDMLEDGANISETSSDDENIPRSGNGSSEYSMATSNTHHNVDEKEADQDEDYDESIVDKIDEKRGMKIRRGDNYEDDEDDEDDEDEDDEDEDEDEDDEDDEDDGDGDGDGDDGEAPVPSDGFFNWNEMEKFADELEQVEVCFILPYLINSSL
jgi:hypothetical protein